MFDMKESHERLEQLKEKFRESLECHVDINKCITEELERLFGKGTTWRWNPADRSRIDIFPPPKPLDYINATIEVKDA